MNSKWRFPVAALLVATSFGMTAGAAESRAAAPGLEPIEVKHVDEVYKLPGASLASYKQVLLRPVTVAFSKRWDPKDYGGRQGLRSADVEKIRNSLAKLADETFRKTLSKGGYPAASAAGENVLEVEARIVDVYINAPDVPTSDVRRSYVLSAGEMRVLVSLRDSVTGTLLYSASDKKRDPETGRLEWANDIWNMGQAEIALTSWANMLKRALDDARKP